MVRDGDLCPTGTGGDGQGWWQGPVLYIPRAGEGNAGPELPCPCRLDWAAELSGAHQGQRGGSGYTGRDGHRVCNASRRDLLPQCVPSVLLGGSGVSPALTDTLPQLCLGSTLGLQDSLEHSKDLLLGSPCLNTAGTEPGLSLIGPGQCWPCALPACSFLTKCQLMPELPLLPLPVPITADLLCGHPGGPGLCLLGGPGQASRR